MRGGNEMSRRKEMGKIRLAFESSELSQCLVHDNPHGGGQVQATDFWVEHGNS